MARLAESEFGIMKKSSDWVRQPGLDKMLDQLVEERGCTPAELIPYDAAKALDIEPSGEFYKKVRDWKQRRAAECDTPVMEVPPHVQAEFRKTVDRFADDAMNSFVHAVRLIGGDFNRTTMLRVAAAERRAEDARAEADSLLDQWTAAEAERDAAQIRAAELVHALADAQRREEALIVRLEERDALLRMVKLTTADAAATVIADEAPPVGSIDDNHESYPGDAMVVDPSTTRSKHDGAEPDVMAGVSADPTRVADEAPSLSTVSERDEAEMASTNPVDRCQGDRVEMPFADRTGGEHATDGDRDAE